VAEPIHAPVPGTVWRVLVAPGQNVLQGDEIAILESMKMEVPVEAPANGKVVNIAVVEGQVIEEGDLVAELE
jgi:acetyl-CoA carboxylase biotin carboxyl carrier protein